MKWDLIFNIVLTTYMPSEPLVLKGFWAKNVELIVSFKKIRDWWIPNFEKRIRYDWQLLSILNFLTYRIRVHIREVIMANSGW